MPYPQSLGGWMSRTRLFLSTSLIALSLTRCECQQTLDELPKPEIEVRDPASGRTNDDPKLDDDGNTPLAIDFGTGEVGTLIDRVIEISNKGTDTLQITNISFAPADPSETRCPMPSAAITFKTAAEQQRR